MIKQVIWSSTIDWPNEISTVLFFDECNFKCSYCHNKDLSLQFEIKFEDILVKLIDRKSIIDHIVLSGGEPTIADNFIEIVNCLYDNGFKVGIHTNGSCFNVFDQVKDKISFVGLDIKSTPFKYTLYSKELFNWCLNINEYLSFISSIQYDVRTTLDKHITIEDLVWIAKNSLCIFDIKEWILQYEIIDGKQIHHFKPIEYEEISRRLNELLRIKFR